MTKYRDPAELLRRGLTPSQLEATRLDEKDKFIKYVASFNPDYCGTDQLKAIIKRARVLTMDYNMFWSDEDNCYIVTWPQFPGTSAFGDTKEEAIKEARIAYELLIEASIGYPKKK